jgi:hypothetical protein
VVVLRRQCHGPHELVAIAYCGGDVPRAALTIAEAFAHPPSWAHLLSMAWARNTHVMAAHTRPFPAQFQPLASSLYAERLHKARN